MTIKYYDGLDILSVYANRFIEIDGYIMDVYKCDSDIIVYTFPCESIRIHRANFNYCEWTRHRHGNSPSGTKYGWFRIQLPNGKRKYINLYV